MRKHLLFALAATAALVSLAAPAAHAEEWTNGEVRKIDAANAKITLKHEYIKVIDMPPMSMVFPLADAMQLDGLKPGYAVRFVVDVQSGKMLITQFERTPVP